MEDGVIDPIYFPCFTNASLNLSNPCDLFPCLNNISGCGQSSYLDQMHLLYCNNIKDESKNFDSKGQAVLKCAAACITPEHHQAYREGVIPCCYSIETWGLGAMQENCYKSCDFCNAYMSNAGAFTQLFHNTPIVAAQIYFKYCQ